MVVFADMVKDKKQTGLMADDFAVLQQQGTPAEIIKVSSVARVRVAGVRCVCSAAQSPASVLPTHLRCPPVLPQVYPRTVYPTYFSDRSYYVNESESCCRLCWGTRMGALER